jgi:rhodanese-related sulfurtransferase
VTRRTTVDDLLAEARRGVRRLEPAEALAEQRSRSLLVDLRSADERRREGVVPGSLHLPRSVLEWRVDPGSWRNPAVGDLDTRLVLVCADGWSSSLAVASLRRLGFAGATDVVGGFRAWAAAGLPVRAAAAPPPGAPCSGWSRPSRSEEEGGRRACGALPGAYSQRVPLQFWQTTPECWTLLMSWHAGDAAKPVQTGSVPSVRPERKLAFVTLPLRACVAFSAWLQAMYLPRTTLTFCGV